MNTLVLWVSHALLLHVKLHTVFFAQGRFCISAVALIYKPRVTVSVCKMFFKGSAEVLSCILVNSSLAQEQSEVICSCTSGCNETKQSIMGMSVKRSLCT